MRDYSKVAPQFWIGDTGRKLRGNPEAQIVAFYLISNPHANMIGMYYMPKMFIAHETGLPFEGASKGLQRCIEADFCGYDEDTEVVWVYKMARFQIAEQLKVEDKRCTGIQKDYNDIPQSRFLPAFFDKYATAFNLTERRTFSSPSQAPSKPHRSQEQEQEQEQKKEQEQEQGSGAQNSGLAISAAGNPASAPPEKPETAFQNACRQTWHSYSTAYLNRYDTEPVRNATVNAQVKAFVKRIGAEEAPLVAAFFVKNNAAFYVQRGHSFGNLLSDAEKIRTEWATGHSITTTRARQIDRTQANKSVVGEAMKILEGMNHGKAA